MTFRELANKHDSLKFIDYRETPISSVLADYDLQIKRGKLDFDYEYNDFKAYLELELEEITK